VLKVFAAIGSLLLAGCTVVGVRSGTEESPYTVVERLGDDLEVRTYAARVAAETTVDKSGEDGRNAAFRRLFDYITGANQRSANIAMTAPVAVADASEKIAMTVPVATAPSGTGGMAMRFFLPAELTAATAPQPADPNVRIVPVPTQTLAVLRFSGSTSDAAVAGREAELVARLQGKGWKPTAAPLAMFYDPPWTVPFLRRNEVAVPVERR